jgi:hypothetical protein
MTLSDELGKLGELRASGALTEEEFTRAKERLLNTPGAAQGARSEEPAVSAVNAFRRSRARRCVRRHGSGNGRGVLGVAAAFRRPVHFRGSRAARLRALVDLRAERVSRALECSAAFRRASCERVQRAQFFNTFRHRLAASHGVAFPLWNCCNHEHRSDQNRWPANAGHSLGPGRRCSPDPLTGGNRETLEDARARGGVICAARCVPACRHAAG